MKALLIHAESCWPPVYDRLVGISQHFGIDTWLIKGSEPRVPLTPDAMRRALLLADSANITVVPIFRHQPVTGYGTPSYSPDSQHLWMRRSLAWQTQQVERCLSLPEGTPGWRGLDAEPDWGGGDSRRYIYGSSHHLMHACQPWSRICESLVCLPGQMEAGDEIEAIMMCADPWSTSVYACDERTYSNPSMAPSREGWCACRGLKYSPGLLYSLADTQEGREFRSRWSNWFLFPSRGASDLLNYPTL